MIKKVINGVSYFKCRTKGCKVRLVENEVGPRYGLISKHVTHEDDTAAIIGFRSKAAMKQAIALAPSTMYPLKRFFIESMSRTFNEKFKSSNPIIYHLLEILQDS